MEHELALKDRKNQIWTDQKQDHFDRKYASMLNYFLIQEYKFTQIKGLKFVCRIKNLVKNQIAKKREPLKKSF